MKKDCEKPTSTSFNHRPRHLFLAFHKFLLSVLETVQSKYKGQAAADASSYITLCFNGQASHGIDRKTFEVMTNLIIPRGHNLFY